MKKNLNISLLMLLATASSTEIMKAGANEGMAAARARAAVAATKARLAAKASASASANTRISTRESASARATTSASPKATTTVKQQPVVKVNSLKVQPKITSKEELINLAEDQSTPTPMFEDVNGAQNPTQFNPSMSLRISNAANKIYQSLPSFSSKPTTAANKSFMPIESLEESVSLAEGQSTPTPMFEDVNGAQNPTQFNPSMSLRISNAANKMYQALPNVSGRISSLRTAIQKAADKANKPVTVSVMDEDGKFVLNEDGSNKQVTLTPGKSWSNLPIRGLNRTIIGVGTAGRFTSQKVNDLYNSFRSTGNKKTVAQDATKEALAEVDATTNPTPEQAQQVQQAAAAFQASSPTTLQSFNAALQSLRTKISNIFAKRPVNIVADSAEEVFNTIVKSADADSFTSFTDPFTAPEGGFTF